MIIFTFIFSYLLGSIPFGLLFSKFFLGQDIRKIGSGNIGATNVLRSGSKKVALFTLLCDFLKAVIPVVLARFFAPDYVFMAGGLAVLGHVFPLWLKFKGGKGVASALGVYWAYNPLLGLLISITWFLIAKCFRISSLSAICAFMIAPLYAWILNLTNESIIFSIFMAVFIIFTHRDNIKRLIKREEKAFK